MRNYKLVGELCPFLFFISNICYQCRSNYLQYIFKTFVYFSEVIFKCKEILKVITFACADAVWQKKNTDSWWVTLAMLWRPINNCCPPWKSAASGLLWNSVWEKCSLLLPLISSRSIKFIAPLILRQSVFLTNTSEYIWDIGIHLIHHVWKSVIQCFDPNNPLAVKWKCTCISLSQWDMSEPQNMEVKELRQYPTKIPNGTLYCSCISILHVSLEHKEIHIMQHNFVWGWRAFMKWKWYDGS